MGIDGNGLSIHGNHWESVGADHPTRRNWCAVVGQCAAVHSFITTISQLVNRRSMREKNIGARKTEHAKLYTSHGTETSAAGTGTSMAANVHQQSLHTSWDHSRYQTLYMDGREITSLDASVPASISACAH